MNKKNKIRNKYIYERGMFVTLIRWRSFSNLRVSHLIWCVMLLF